jgi:hypothetical protein
VKELKRWQSFPTARLRGCSVLDIKNRERNARETIQQIVNAIEYSVNYIRCLVLSLTLFFVIPSFVPVSVEDLKVSKFLPKWPCVQSGF